MADILGPQYSVYRSHDHGPWRWQGTRASFTLTEICWAFSTRSLQLMTMVQRDNSTVQSVQAHLSFSYNTASVSLHGPLEFCSVCQEMTVYIRNVSAAFSFLQDLNPKKWGKLVITPEKNRFEGVPVQWNGHSFGHNIFKLPYPPSIEWRNTLEGDFPCKQDVLLKKALLISIYAGLGPPS